MATVQEVAPRASRPALNPYRNILFFPSQPSSRSPNANRLQCLCTRPSFRRRAGGRPSHGDTREQFCLFAKSAQAMRQRLETEGRVGPRCFVLQVFKVKGGIL